MSATGEIRIIAGQWKRTIIPVAPVLNLRPTPNRIRETLFNWLGQDLSGLTCLDAFAGTGALAFEAASRLAAQVLVFEKDTLATQYLRVLQTKLSAKNMHIRQGDAMSLMASLDAASIDVIFLDPPFQSDLYVPALHIAARLMRDKACIYLEANRLWSDEQLDPFGLCTLRHAKAGMVYYHLLQKKTSHHHE